MMKEMLDAGVVPVFGSKYLYARSMGRLTVYDAVADTYMCSDKSNCKQ